MCVQLQQHCDNLGDVAAINKCFSTAKPLCFALQALAAHAVHHNIALDVQHIPGKQNDLADALSRLTNPSSLELVPENQFNISVGMLLAPFAHLLEQEPVVPT